MAEARMAYNTVADGKADGGRVAFWRFGKILWISAKAWANMRHELDPFDAQRDAD
jgi:hypothetical protein